MKEYKIIEYIDYCSDNRIREQIENIPEHISNNILLIKNSNNHLNNIFDSIEYSTKYLTDYSKELNLYWIDLRLTWIHGWDCNDYDDEFKKTNQIIKWIESRTIEISARWYSQGDYDNYKIIILKKELLKETEESLSFIKRLFTYSEVRLTLYERDKIKHNNKNYYSERIFNDETSASDIDTEELTKELLNNNSITEKIENIKIERC